MKISIGSDHAGYKFKNEIIDYLKKKGVIIADEGCYSEESADYPDFAHKVGKKVNMGIVDFGIVVCGSGNGVNMVVNKYPEVRGALCWSEEISKMARLHNDSNVCAIPARYISLEKALKIVGIFIKTRFEGGRHQKRIDKININ